MGSLWPKYIMFELQKYRWSFMTLKSDAKFEEKLTANNNLNILNGKFIHWQVSELLTDLDWKIWFAYSNFSGKNEVILLKSSAFRKLQVLMELIFWFNF